MSLYEWGLFMHEKHNWNSPLLQHRHKNMTKPRLTNLKTGGPTVHKHHIPGLLLRSWQVLFIDTIAQSSGSSLIKETEHIEASSDCCIQHGSTLSICEIDRDLEKRWD